LAHRSSARPESTIIVGLMRAWIAAALVIGTVACASTRSGTVPASAATSPAHETKVELLAPAVDLTGAWTTGSGSEPPAGPVVHRPQCTYHPAVWIIQQSGNTLKAWAMPERFDQGVVRRGPGAARATGSPGTVSGADVVIDDGQDRYVLRYDRESGHLRGTRNGAPFWAARQQVVRPDLCPGVP